MLTQELEQTCLMFMCVLGHHVASTAFFNLSESTDTCDSFSGKLCKDKECPFRGVTNFGSLDEGGGKQCSECTVSNP